MKPGNNSIVFAEMAQNISIFFENPALFYHSPQKKEEFAERLFYQFANRKVDKTIIKEKE